MEGHRFWQYMVAGSVAGMAEHMAMFPVDTLKTRMQTVAASASSSSQHHHPTVGRLLASIVRSEGPAGLYRGIAAIGLGAGPAHAAYFAVYELCKDRLGGNRQDGRHHPLIHAASGVAATISSDALLTPMDVVKQRLQLRWSPYSGVRDCVVRMLRDEGIKAFYASYRTTVLMNAPFTAVHFATYEAVKKILTEIAPENANEDRLSVHLTAGGAAGALASAVTTPLDVVKTRLQCQAVLRCLLEKKISGEVMHGTHTDGPACQECGVCGADTFNGGSIRMVMEKIVAKEGPRALLQGLKPRVLFHAPAAAICWSTYEAMKSFLQRNTHQISSSP